MVQEKKLPARSEIAAEHKWKIEDLYAEDKLWEADFGRLKEMAEEFQSFQGTLGQSGEKLYEGLKKKDELSMLLERVYVYASQKNHEDMGNGTYQQMFLRSQGLMSQVEDACSFLEPELLKIPSETLERFLQEVPELSLYRRYLDEKRRMGKHILSEEMEGVLAKASRMGEAPQNIFQMFNNADLDFGMITRENGEKVQLTHGRYVQFLESRDRSVRKEAFERLYEKYAAFRNTLAAAFDANAAQELFFAKMRNYGSSLEAALDGGNIPLTVYTELIQTVEQNLYRMHDYVSLRKKLLQVEELHMYDVYVPLTESRNDTYSFEEAKKLVKAGLAPLGEDYLKILQEGFDHRWIDIYENQGKRSGAYSWGAFGTHPYVLMNYNGSLNHVFTLAHEMGHAIHSYYSDHMQPYVYAGYRIFVAEVASTCNEALLIHYLLEKAQDASEKRYLINYFLDQFRGTLFRQTMFAQFEQNVHQMAAEGQSLTADVLCQVYRKLNESYFGADMVIDPQIDMEWARIPHFYNAFYVYQYATGFSAAIAISSKILKGEPGIVEKYKTFLAGGSSKDPIDLLKICGIDMTSPEPVNEALAVFGQYLDELKRLS